MRNRRSAQGAALIQRLSPAPDHRDHAGGHSHAATAGPRDHRRPGPAVPNGASDDADADRVYAEASVSAVQQVSRLPDRSRQSMDALKALDLTRRPLPRLV